MRQVISSKPQVRSASLPSMRNPLVDKVNIGKSLAHSSLKSSFVLSDSSESDEGSTGRHVVKPDPYTTRELCRSLVGIPYWDGKSLSWKSFLKEWKAYWSFQKSLVSPDQKKWIFVRALPSSWKNHMKACILDNKWDYPDIVSYLGKNCDILVPDWKKERLWRNCLPRGNSFIAFQQWWMSWLRLGTDCDLRDIDWIHQFDLCMKHNGNFTKYLTEILELELCDDAPWDLSSRKTYVENKLAIASKTQESFNEISDASGPQTSGLPNVTCYTCGRKGHLSSQCLSKSSSKNWSKPSSMPKQDQGSLPKSSNPRPTQGSGGGYRDNRQPFIRHQPQQPSAPRAGKGFSGGRPLGQGPTSSSSPSFQSSKPPVPTPKVAKSPYTCIGCGKPGHFWRDCPVKNLKVTVSRLLKGFFLLKVLTDRLPSPYPPIVSQGKGKGRGKGKGKGKGKGSVRLLDTEGHEDDDFIESLEEEFEECEECEEENPFFEVDPEDPSV